MSTRGLEDDLGHATLLLDLAVRRPRAGRKSATAAAMTTTSAPGATALDRLVHLGRGLDPHHVDRRRGAGRPTVVTSVTLAPRAAASAARAWPCLPEERLPTKRTGSMGSRVPPAVTTTCSPARSRSGRQGGLDGRDDRLGRGEATRGRCRPRPGGPPRAPRCGRPGGRAWRCCPARRGAATSRCAWRGTRTTGRLGGEQGGGQQVVGDAGRVGADDPGGGGGHDHQVGRLAEAGVRDGVGVVEQRRAGPLGRQRREGGLAHEAGGAPRSSRGRRARPRRPAAGRPRSPCRPRCHPRPPGRCAAPRAQCRPTRTRPPRRQSPSPASLGAGHDDLVAGDLLEGDRQRLAGHRGDLRRHDGAEALAELVEVRVDLPGTHGAQRDQRELGTGATRRALRSTGSSSCLGVKP